MDPALVIIGVSFRSAPVAVREKFWINESGYAETLAGLLRCEAVDEVAVLSTCNRTEFIVWTSDASQAANSVLRYLTREYNLRLAEWSKFHRHVDDAAMNSPAEIGLGAGLAGVRRGRYHGKNRVRIQSWRTGTIHRPLPGGDPAEGTRGCATRANRNRDRLEPLPELVGACRACPPALR